MPVLYGWNPATGEYEPMGGSAPAGVMGDAPRARVKRSTNLPLTSGTNAAVPFDVVDRDTHGFWSAAAPTRLTIPAGQAGPYEAVFNWYAYANGGATRIIAQISRSGVNVSRTELTGIAINNEPAGNVVWNGDLAVGDYIEATVFPISAAVLFGGVGVELTLTLTRQAVGQPGPMGPAGPAGAVGTGATPPIRRVYGASTTWTKPAGLLYIEVEVQGAGGGGGGSWVSTANFAAASAGGGGGGYSRKVFAADVLPATCAVTVGAYAAGGAAGYGGTAGTGATGGTSSFAGSGITTVQGNGGTGGAGGSNGAWAYAAPGAGGMGSGGDTFIPGGDGGNGWVIAASIPTSSPTGGGWGGNSAMCGVTAAVANTTGASAKGYGGGGAGSMLWGMNNGFVGGTGASGLVVVTEHYV